VTPLPTALERLRCAHVANARQGVPAHVTLLYPFARPARNMAGLRGAVAEACRAVAPFEFALTAARIQGSIAYLAPRPERHLVRLIVALATAFPEYPRYGGAYAEILPHVTLAESSEGPLLEAVRAEAAHHVPIQQTARAVVLLREGEDGRWRRGWRVPLGGRA
jgi:2'-5' RNA ligase